VGKAELRDATHLWGKDIAETEVTLRQAFNIREGISAKDFKLPERVSAPPATDPIAGLKVDFDAFRKSFYQALGWDPATGNLQNRPCKNLD